MRSESDSYAIIERALDAANGPADADFVSTDQNISRFANSGIHQNMSEVSASLTLRVIVDGAMGVASTSSFTPEDLAETAALAREAARHADPLQNFSGLYRDDGEPLPVVTTFDRITASVSPADKARALKAMFDRGRDTGVQFAGTYATSASSVACGNTNGVRRYAMLTAAETSVIAFHGPHSGYATRISRRVDDLDILSIGEEAMTKATLLTDALEDLEPGAFDVILEPPAIAEVLEWLSHIALSGQTFEDGSSFMAGRIGERLLGVNFTLTDDALDNEFLPFPFDMEGLPKRRIPLIERGIVRTPALDRAYADRLNLPATANCWNLGSPDHGAPFHMAVAPGVSTREDLIASTRLGIWVTRFNYVNGLLEPKTALMTGTTRDGTFLIRDGRVAARLPNLRWTQSMLEAFSNIESMSRDRQRAGIWYNMFGGVLAPVMKIKGWSITGKQEGA